MGNIINFVISYHYQLRDHFFGEPNYTNLNQDDNKNPTNDPESNGKNKHGEFTEHDLESGGDNENMRII